MINDAIDQARRAVERHAVQVARAALADTYGDDPPPDLDERLARTVESVVRTEAAAGALVRHGIHRAHQVAGLRVAVDGAGVAFDWTATALAYPVELLESLRDVRTALELYEGDATEARVSGVAAIMARELGGDVESWRGAAAVAVRLGATHLRPGVAPA